MNIHSGHSSNETRLHTNPDPAPGKEEPVPKPDDAPLEPQEPAPDELPIPPIFPTA